jgi:hypothetical protein
MVDEDIARIGRVYAIANVNSDSNPHTYHRYTQALSYTNQLNISHAIPDNKRYICLRLLASIQDAWSIATRQTVKKADAPPSSHADPKKTDRPIVARIASSAL